MSHPFQKYRQAKIERARVGDITKAYAAGGGVHKDAAQDRKLIRKEVRSMAIEGDLARPRRATGGAVKKSGVTVNVITQAPQPPQQPPMPPAPPPMAGPPPGGPPPGMPPKPPGPPMAAGPGMPPPGMPMRARGGAVNKGTKVFNASKAETPVKHDKGKNDLSDLNRGRVVTFKAGGRVVSFSAKMPGGAGGGLGRLKKAAMTHNGSQV